MVKKSVLFFAIIYLNVGCWTIVDENRMLLKPSYSNLEPLPIEEFSCLDTNALYLRIAGIDKHMFAMKMGSDGTFAEVYMYPDKMLRIEDFEIDSNSVQSGRYGLWKGKPVVEEYLSNEPNSLGPDMRKVRRILVCSGDTIYFYKKQLTKKYVKSTRYSFDNGVIQIN